MRGSAAPVVGIALAFAIAAAGAVAAQSRSGELTSRALLPLSDAGDPGPAMTVTDPQRTAPAQQAPTPVEPAPEVKAAPAKAVLEMSHVWQSLNNCGPASVVMALSTFGIDVEQETARIPLRGSNVLSGMGPQRVNPWVSEQFGLRSVWRNNGTNDLLKRLVANGFAPMVTQWMEQPPISRIAHWRAVRGYDDALATFYVNDPMLGRMVPLSYSWFHDNWQPFSFRYLVIYRPSDEPLLKAIVGDDWSDLKMRANFYERAKAEAMTSQTTSAWLAYGEASYGYGAFAEAVAAFEHGMSLGSVQGVFTLRSSYPQALRALGRQKEADAMAQRLSTATSSATVAAPPDPYALYLAYLRTVSEDEARLTE